MIEFETEIFESNCFSVRFELNIGNIESTEGLEASER